MGLWFRTILFIVVVVVVAWSIQVYLLIYVYARFTSYNLQVWTGQGEYSVVIAQYITIFVNDRAGKETCKCVRVVGGGGYSVIIAQYITIYVNGGARRGICK